MNRDELVQKTLQSDELPTLPVVATKLISLTSKEDTTLADIAGLISQDIALSSKVLKVSNSAFYSTNLSIDYEFGWIRIFDRNIQMATYQIVHGNIWQNKIGC